MMFDFALSSVEDISTLHHIKKVHIFVFQKNKKAPHVYTKNNQNIGTIRRLTTERVLCVPQSKQTFQIQKCLRKK